MNYLATSKQTLVTRATEMLDNSEEITTNTCNIYKTKMDMLVTHPQRDIPLRLISIDHVYESDHEKKLIDDIQVIEDSMQKIDSGNNVEATENMDPKLDGGVETRSCGKISELINQFNSVETSLPVRTISPKIPTKKLRVDFESVVHGIPNDITQTTNTSCSHDMETNNVKKSQRVWPHTVTLNAKMSQDNPHLSRSHSSDTGRTVRTKHFPILTVTTSKPLIKPRSFKDWETLHGLQKFELPQTHETCDLTPSEGSPVPLSPLGEDCMFRCDHKADMIIKANNSATSDKEHSFCKEATPCQSCNQQQHQIVPCNTDDCTFNNQSADTKSDNASQIPVTVCKPLTEEPIVKGHNTEEAQDTPLTVSEVTLLHVEKHQHLNTATLEVIHSDNKQLTHGTNSAQLFSSNSNVGICHQEPGGTNNGVIAVESVNCQTERLNSCEKLKDIIDHQERLEVVAIKNVTPTNGHNLHHGYSSSGDLLTNKLDMLKSELMAMRRMDLVLLKQLITISQTIQRIHRADVPKFSRSMTILNPNNKINRRCRSVERQNSAPHSAARRRFLFTNFRSNTEDDYRDSLSSFEESEVDSAPSEVDESNSSLNSITTSSPKAAATRRKFFQSRDLFAADDVEQDYEDILNRNVRLWKMSFQRQQSVQEEIDVWC